MDLEPSTPIQLTSRLVTLLQNMNPAGVSEYFAVVLHAMILEEEFVAHTSIAIGLEKSGEDFIFTYSMTSILGVQVILKINITEDYRGTIIMTAEKPKHSVKLKVQILRYIQDGISTSTLHLSFKNLNELRRLCRDQLIDPLLYNIKIDRGLPLGKESICYLNDDCLLQIFEAVDCHITLSRLSEVSKRFRDINEN